jgi:hypothetical protein
MEYEVIREVDSSEEEMWAHYIWENELFLHGKSLLFPVRNVLDASNKMFEHADGAVENPNGPQNQHSNLRKQEKTYALIFLVEKLLQVYVVKQMKSSEKTEIRMLILLT